MCIGTFYFLSRKVSKDKRRSDLSTCRKEHYYHTIDKPSIKSQSQSMSEELMPSSKKANRPRSCSLGEELWQVHLQRSLAAGKNLDDEDDHDFPEPRHPKRSIGEELFKVHLKRSKGLEPDCDTNDEKNEKEVVGDKANKAG